MDNQKALKIVRFLANGIDPETGEEIVSCELLNRPNIIRALHLTHTALEQACKHKQKTAALPDNVGKPWSLDEEKELTAAFSKGIDISEISIRHKRTKGGISSRLAKLGLVIR